MKKRILVALGITLAIAAGSVGYNAIAEKPAKDTPAMKKSVTKLEKIDKVVGNGSDAFNGATVTVNYTGWLYDPDKPEGKGQKFDSSLDRNEAFTFTLGSGMVIKGWDEGVLGMNAGGKRTLIIPSSMGYGSSGAGGVIPPNATLLFDVELLRVM